MGEPTNSSTSSNDPIFDAMPEIPTFEPAPVPKPVVTDTMPPIPVTAPVPTPAPAKPAGMPVFGASQAPAPAQAPINAAPVQRPVQNPAPMPNPARMSAPVATPNPALMPSPAVMQTPAPQASAAPQVPRFNPAVLQSNQSAQPIPRPVQQTAPQSAPTQPINPAMSAALDAAMRGENPVLQPAPNTAPTPNVQPNTQPMPNAAPAMPPMPPEQPQFTNPFAEAMEKNREIRNVSFSSQDSRPIAQAPLKGGNKKRLIILGLIVVVLLLIVVAAVAAMSSKKPETPAEPAPTTPISTNTPGDYLCEKTYLESEFEPFGTPVAATAKVYFTFDTNGLEKIKSEQVITYDDSDAAKAAFTKLSTEHEAAYAALNLTEDPVSALYKRSGSDLKITYNATALDLTNDTLKFFDVETTQVIDTITSDDMQDLYEANSYTCGTAPVETTE
ncbi:MAG: hypothetical protein K6G36_03550 [Candidatus Saccharibacteria bacterium]|nr:hypothetical protein [Candidatus Saccharibacteria bacterium]